MNLKKSVCGAATAILLGVASAAFAAYPEKPIHIVNYVAPGGLMDVTSRKFVAVAQKYVPEVTFVVENVTGAGGLIALGQVLQLPADGYTVFAPTTAVVDKVLSAGKSEDDLIWSMEWVAMLMRDPECVIGAAEGDFNTFEKVLADAKAKDGSQLWSGPAPGGNDHLLAVKIWNTVGIKAKWVPYKSGPLAMAGTLSGQSVAYVGNPADMAGRPGYKILALCRKERLPQFPDAPTFAELGYEGLDNEIMWRGFAIRKGAPEEVYQWWENLNRKVAQDPEWTEYLTKDGIDIVDWGRKEFTLQVKTDVENAKAALRAAGMIK